MTRPRIILADDHRLMLDALTNLLEPEFEVVGTFTDGQALVECALKFIHMSSCSTSECRS